VTEANYDEVICPNCVTQFRAIPVNVQNEIAALKAERDDLKSSELGLNRYTAKINSENTALTTERDALKDAARMALDVLDMTTSCDDNCQCSRRLAIAALKAVL